MVDSSVGSNAVPWPDLGIDGEPELLFQPAFDLATGRLFGFEALLRLRRCVPVPGYISPDQLIPTAEANGHMTAVNRWVLSEACYEAVSWPPEVQLAVNCSVFQLRRNEAAPAAASAIGASGLDPGRLSIEVTGTALADDGTAADLHALSRLGIRLTLDDMGSDLLSLKNLSHLSVNTVKIAGSLIGGLEQVGASTRAIVETTVKVTHSLGLCAAAKSVETAGQAATLREIGADVGQGYFYSPPLAAEHALALTHVDTPASGPIMVPTTPESQPDIP